MSFSREVWTYTCASPTVLRLSQMSQEKCRHRQRLHPSIHRMFRILLLSIIKTHCTYAENAIDLFDIYA